MSVWLTVDGERKGPYRLEILEGDGYVLLPYEEEWLSLTGLDEISRMGIVEMRLK